MALVLPKDGLLFLAEALRRGFQVSPTAALFTGPLVITPDTTLSDCNAVEATFGGYARQPLPPWSPAVLSPSGSALITAGPVTFKQTVTPPDATVTGYYLVCIDWALTLRLLGAERFGKNLPFKRVNQELLLTVPLSSGSFF